MPDMTNPNLSSVSETLLITLYIRAVESQRPDALIKDEIAEALVKKISNDGLYDFNRIKSLHLSEANKLAVILRNREFDYYAWDFLTRHPNAVVVHIGCGLDTRFERVDNGQVEWYDLDLPEVIGLRRKLIGETGRRCHLLSCSVLNGTWLDTFSARVQPPFLFIAEGVFMYFTEAQIKSLVLTLYDRFPGSELVFDALSPIHVWRHNLQIHTFKVADHVNWGIWRGQEIESWADPSTSPKVGGIRLLDEWGFFDRPEPRLAYIRWLRPIEALVRTIRIYHFQLG